MGRTRELPVSRDESSYPKRQVRGVGFRTSRAVFDDLTVIIKRFPGLPGAPEDGRPFVLVHGIGVSSRYFQPAAAELAKYGRVYDVDLPGYGMAPDPKRDVTIADHAAVLQRFLSEAGIVDPVLVGHSMGTQIVTQLAIDFPDVTDRLVLIGPTMDPEARTVGKAAARMSLDMLREPWNSNFVVLTDYLIRCGIPYYLRQLPHLLNDRPEERFPIVAAKTLVMRGDRDPVCPREWTDTVTALLPNGSSREVKGPHVVMFTDPVGVAAHIAEHARS